LLPVSPTGFCRDTLVEATGDTVRYEAGARWLNMLLNYF